MTPVRLPPPAMLPARVLRRNFSLFNRVPYGRIARSAARDGHETVTIHRVHISKPVMSRSRMIGAVAIAAAFYGLSRYISVEVEVEKVDGKGQASNRPDGQWTEVGEEEEDEDEDDAEALLFLPTGFAREKKRNYYKGSDPEWQEFKKVSTDRARAERIRNQLIKIVRVASEQDKRTKNIIGTMDASKGRAWIELIFPNAPPVEYERPGIELTDELEWRKSTRPVADAHHKRLNSLLYPKNVANAVYQDIKRKAALSWQSFRSYSGWGEKPQSEDRHSVVQRAIAGMDAIARDAKASAGPTSISTSTPTAADANKQPAETPSPSRSQTKELGFVLPDPKQLTLDLKQFHQDFRKGVKKVQTQPPRGTLVVKGLIEVYGDKGRLTWQVLAFYDPKVGRYVDINQMAVFSFIPHKQSPHG